MGIVLRSLGLVPGLFIGTALIGAGIAVSNVILPGLIKHYFPHQVGLLTSLYTTVMALSAGIASGLSAPLAFQLDLGWQYALLIWGACAFLALVIWLPFTRLKPDIKPGAVQTQSSFGPMWRSALAWQVTFYMGSQSLLFYSLNTWLPEILISKGMEVTAAGWLLAYMQFIGLPATFLAPVLANRFTDQKWLAASTGLFIMVGLVGLLLDPSLTLVIVWVSLVAIGSGAAVSLALTLMGLRSQTAQQAAQLSGMAQSIGYLLAAVGPVLLGALFDLTHSWSLPIILLIINGLFLSVTGLGAGRDRYVL
jgi:CP family cyanate transporter-like MFS transporter